MTALESLNPALFSRLVDSLYVDAMVMADEARSYFDRKAEEDRGGLDMMARLTFSCESLKVTTRLMHVIAWLLSQKAWQRGEITAEALSDPKYRLGSASQTDMSALAVLPPCARDLVTGSQSLYDRVRRLQEQMLQINLTPAPVSDIPNDDEVPGQARDLLARLERAF